MTQSKHLEMGGEGGGGRVKNCAVGACDDKAL